MKEIESLPAGAETVTGEWLKLAKERLIMEQTIHILNSYAKVLESSP